jgi:hypothetical protein
MMDKTKLLDYFNEHVFYEVQMLNYAKYCLESPRSQNEWNVMFAAFNVSARNLYYFVGKRDTGNMNVDDYRPYMGPFERGSIEKVKETMRLLEAQCLHLGEDRFKEPNRKINIERIRTMHAWITSRMVSLRKSFKDDFRPEPEWDTLLDQGLKVPTGPTGPSASAIFGILSTGTTTVGEFVTFDVPPKE